MGYVKEQVILEFMELILISKVPLKVTQSLVNLLAYLLKLLRVVLEILQKQK